MITDLIEFELSLSGTPLIRLTEHTIQSVDFITTKARDFRKQKRDIALRLKFENASVYFRTPMPNTDNEESGNDDEIKPDELDSVRNLLVFSVCSNKTQIAYLDGEVRIGNELGQITKLSYKDLFVLSCSEEYAENTRITYIEILMREKAR